MSTLVEASQVENKIALYVCGAAHNIDKTGLPDLLANQSRQWLLQAWRETRCLV